MVDVVIIFFYIYVIFSGPAVQGDHGNHHVTPKQEKMPTNVKVLLTLAFLPMVVTGFIHLVAQNCGSDSPFTFLNL